MHVNIAIHQVQSHMVCLHDVKDFKLKTKFCFQRVPLYISLKLWSLRERSYISYIVHHISYITG